MQVARRWLLPAGGVLGTLTQEDTGTGRRRWGGDWQGRAPAPAAWRGSGVEPRPHPLWSVVPSSPAGPGSGPSTVQCLPFHQVPRHRAALASSRFCCQVPGSPVSPLHLFPGFLPCPCAARTEARAGFISTRLQCAGDIQTLCQEALRASALPPLPRRSDKASGEPGSAWATCVLQVTTVPSGRCLRVLCWAPALPFLLRPRSPGRVIMAVPGAPTDIESAHSGNGRVQRTGGKWEKRARGTRSLRGRWAVCLSFLYPPSFSLGRRVFGEAAHVGDCGD